jgi:hypothetical protein
LRNRRRWRTRRPLAAGLTAGEVLLWWGLDARVASHVVAAASRVSEVVGDGGAVFCQPLNYAAPVP